MQNVRDPAGFVLVLDERTLAIPDRLGNGRLDTFCNVLVNPHVALIFVIPGITYTLRAVGEAIIVRDAELLARMAVNGKTPDHALVVSISNVFSHCPKCMITRTAVACSSRSQGRARPTGPFATRSGGKESETSLGPYPEMSLDAARIRHLELRAAVAKKIDPVGEREGRGSPPNPTGTPTFGQCADKHIGLHEGGWKNAKHHQQWVMTLREYAAPIRNMPVDQVDTAAILSVLTPIWNTKPETASRLRGRIEAVIASAQVDGWIPEDRSNPARWKNWLDRKLPKPKKLGSRGHHKALPYDQLPGPYGEARGDRQRCVEGAATHDLDGKPHQGGPPRTFDEPDFPAAVWSRPEDHMKMGEAHDVPLSAPALAILRRQHDEHSDSANPHVFPGRPMRPMSNMSMAMLLRRLGVRDVTVHGFRTSFRTWAGENKVTFEIAEYCLAHAVGDPSSQAYNRTTLLELRRPVMAAWGAYVTGDPDWKRYLKDEADSADVPLKQDAA